MKKVWMILVIVLIMTGCSKGEVMKSKSVPENSVEESEEKYTEKDEKENEAVSEELSSEHIQEDTSKELTEEETESVEEETNRSMIIQDYIFPDSNHRYLTYDDIMGLPKKEFRIARNEIYARHGRKFNAQDLQEYFNSKTWYQGTVSPEEFDEAWLNIYEKENIQFLIKFEETASTDDLPEAPSKEIIDRYGYENGHSVLSFQIKEGTLKDCGEYYQVDAVYRQGIEAPANLSEGSQVTLVFNELTGETKTLVYRDGYFYSADANNQYDQYYYHSSSNGDTVVLYQDSDDRVEKPIYEGKLYIRKDATDEVAIINQVEPVTKEKLNREDWYNGVYFDRKGYVMRLVFYGD